MNSIVRSWNRSTSRPKAAGPDALILDEDRFVMADRQPLPGSTALTKQHLKNLITQIKEITIDRVLVLRSETYAALKRLETERDLSKEWKGNPDGSRQFDMGTAIQWIRSIQKDDEKAIAQLVIIDATCCARGT